MHKVLQGSAVGFRTGQNYVNQQTSVCK